MTPTSSQDMSRQPMQDSLSRGMIDLLTDSVMDIDNPRVSNCHMVNKNMFRKICHVSSKSDSSPIFSTGIKVEKNVPMKHYTSFRIGGPADYFARPSSVRELILLIRSAQKCGMPCIIMGSGTNILVRDKGIRGLVVSLVRMRGEIEMQDLNNGHTVVSVSSGTVLAALCHKTIKHGLEDLSFAAGIPGTVGGAVMMNAGTGSGTISDRLISIDVLDQDNNLNTIDRSALVFSHRKLEFLTKNQIDSHCKVSVKNESCLHGIAKKTLFKSSEINGDKSTSLALADRENNKKEVKPVIVRASFLLKKGNREKVQRSWNTLIDKRKLTQPHGIPSAGCFFKNPGTERSAGQLIDMAGLKRKRIGDAMVSDKHANFILNLGNATAQEVVTLKNIVKETVFEKFSINLSEEVIIHGE